MIPVPPGDVCRANEYGHGNLACYRAVGAPSIAKRHVCLLQVRDCCMARVDIPVKSVVPTAGAGVGVDAAVGAGMV